VQAQGNIGVLCRIGARLLQLNLVEFQLFRTLARHILKMNGLQAQVFEGKAVHIVSCRRRVQNVGLQHGVKLDATQCDAVVGEHTGIVFEVLPQLGHVLVFQQGF